MCGRFLWIYFELILSLLFGIWKLFSVGCFIQQSSHNLECDNRKNMAVLLLEERFRQLWLHNERSPTLRAKPCMVSGFACIGFFEIVEFWEPLHRLKFTRGLSCAISLLTTSSAVLFANGFVCTQEILCIHEAFLQSLIIDFSFVQSLLSAIRSWYLSLVVMNSSIFSTALQRIIVFFPLSHHNIFAPQAALRFFSCSNHRRINDISEQCLSYLKRSTDQHTCVMFFC